MVRYILVSSKFEGYLVYAYNKLGYLVQFQNCSYGMSEEQLTAVCMNLKYALSHDNFKQWVANCGHKTIKLDNDLSFDRFWRVFDNARNRIQSEKLWKPMSDEMRQYAFYVHDAYLFYLLQNPWITKMYPDTFLRGHLRDEWFKTKAPEKKQ
jgi:hypothetical protein